MSAIATDVRTEPLYSQRVSGERRSFFFDVRRGQEGGVYLTISQFVRIADEWVRLKLVVPSEDARPFYQGLCEALKALRSADADAEQPAASRPSGKAKERVPA